MNVTSSRFLGVCTLRGSQDQVAVGTVDIGNSPGDVLVAYYSSGKLVWWKSFGTSETDVASSVVCDDEYVLIGGQTAGAFYPFQNQGDCDAFVVKARVGFSKDEFHVEAVQQFGTGNNILPKHISILSKDPSSHVFKVLLAGVVYSLGYETSFFFTAQVEL
eukprot:m.22115 g.22115  ORF g.22115 m.22115 type:complete len:161 (-) comp8804_c0_seq1:53-535(-)